MTTTTATAKPAARTFRFLERFSGNAASIRVTQTRGKREEVTDYDVTLTPVGGGAVSVEYRKPIADLDSRMRSDRYVCLVVAGQPVTCECAGFLRHTHCKHADLAPVLVRECAKGVANG